jgi:hypothetical protein
MRNIRIDIDEEGNILVDLDEEATLTFSPGVARELGNQFLRLADMSERGVRSTAERSDHRAVYVGPKLRVVR